MAGCDFPPHVGDSVPENAEYRSEAIRTTNLLAREILVNKDEMLRMDVDEGAKLPATAFCLGCENASAQDAAEPGLLFTTRRQDFDIAREQDPLMHHHGVWAPALPLLPTLGRLWEAHQQDRCYVRVLGGVLMIMHSCARGGRFRKDAHSGFQRTRIGHGTSE